MSFDRRPVVHGWRTKPKGVIPELTPEEQAAAEAANAARQRQTALTTRGSDPVLALIQASASAAVRSAQSSLGDGPLKGALKKMGPRFPHNWATHEDPEA